MSQINYKFDRPVIILAAPRSGSTLLFEILSKAANAWTIGNESHTIMESIEKYDPTSGLCNSNRLDESHADDNSLNIIREYFHSQLRDRSGTRIDSKILPRFIEKTPKNSLRIPLLNKIFPDAYYIFLYRNPRENISSIMDGWKSQRFVTYQNLKNRDSSWSFLLPPGWEKMHNKSLEETAYFQWKTTNATILDDLQSLVPKKRWTTVSYSSVINDTENTIKALCDFTNLEFDDFLQQTCREKLKMSRYTLSTPSPTKWHKHALELSKVIPPAKHIIKKLRQVVKNPLAVDFDIQVSEDLYKQPKATVNTKDSIIAVSRNTPCPCKSGKKYKHCHGKT